MKINYSLYVFLLMALAICLTSISVWAEEDGKGTNVVRNLRVNDGGTMELGGVPITNWAGVPTGTGAVSFVDFSAYTNAVQDSTNALNTSVTDVSYQVTNVLFEATNALNAAITNLYASTNYWTDGVIIYKGTGAGFTPGNLYCMTNGSDLWTPANATTNTTSQGLIGLALGETPASGLLLNGQFVTNSHSFAVGAPIYLATANSAMTSTRPTGTNEIVRIVGYAIDDSTIMFNPDRTYIEILGE